jgi:hypothetical protein
MNTALRNWAAALIATTARPIVAAGAQQGNFESRWPRDAVPPAQDTPPVAVQQMPPAATQQTLSTAERGTKIAARRATGGLRAGSRRELVRPGYPGRQQNQIQRRSHAHRHRRRNRLSRTQLRRKAHAFRCIA